MLWATHFKPSLNLDWWDDWVRKRKNGKLWWSQVGERMRRPALKVCMKPSTCADMLARSCINAYCVCGTNGVWIRFQNMGHATRLKCVAHNIE